MTSREQNRIAVRKWHQKNALRVCARKHGIDPDIVEGYVAEHSGACDICGKMPGMAHHNDMRLHIDHDHATGEFRGMLCNNCNSMLGQAKDNIETLTAAIIYLLERKDVLMPDLAFSNAGNIVDNWTCQQLVVTPGNVNVGYTVKAPTENKPAEEKVEDNGE